MAIKDHHGQPVIIIAAVEMDGSPIVRIHDQDVLALASLRADGEVPELWEAYRDMLDRTDPKSAMKLRTEYREMLARFERQLEIEADDE